MAADHKFGVPDKQLNARAYTLQGFLSSWWDKSPSHRKLQSEESSVLRFDSPDDASHRRPVGLHPYSAWSFSASFLRIKHYRAVSFKRPQPQLSLFGEFLWVALSLVFTSEHHSRHHLRYSKQVDAPHCLLLHPKCFAKPLYNSHEPCLTNFRFVNNTKFFRISGQLSHFCVTVCTK